MSPERRSPLFRILAGTLALLFFIIFVALGTWQLERRVWKLDLIARVEQRVRAPPVTAPGPRQWPAVTATTDEYRHVTATGTFLDDSQTLVQAVTELGAGYWVLTPLREADGSVVLVNRGFVPSDARDRVERAAVAVGKTESAGATVAADLSAGAGAGISTASTTGTSASGASASATSASAASASAASASTAVTVTGLLRMTEPRGAFLRHNDPAANRWYSRDVQAIRAARRLTHVAPYFIDADAGSSRAPGEAVATSPRAGAGGGQAVATGAGRAAGEPPGGNARVAPVGGLTVVTFRNSHLEYAITWYTLALMVAGAIWLGIRNETRA